MGIAFVIVGGLVLMTLAASVFGYLGEKKKRLDPKVLEKLEQIEHRLSDLENAAGQNAERFDRIENDAAFVQRLLSDRGK